MPFKQRDGNYAIFIDKKVYTPDHLELLAKALKKYGAKLVRLTESQKFMVVGVDPGRIEEFYKDAGIELEKILGVKSVKFCPSDLCLYSLQDSEAMAEALKNICNVELPYKLKIAVSGCPNSCTEPALRDIGLMGTKRGFTIFVGGSAGKRPKIGKVIARNVDFNEALKIVSNIVTYYRDNCSEKLRLGEYIEKIGFKRFKKGVREYSHHHR